MSHKISKEQKLHNKKVYNQKYYATVSKLRRKEARELSKVNKDNNA